MNAHDASVTEVQNASLGLISPLENTTQGANFRDPDDGEEAGVPGTSLRELSINENEILEPPTLAGMERSELLEEGQYSENTALAGLELAEEDETESPLETLQEEHPEDMSSDEPGSDNASHWSFLRFFHIDSEADTTVASAQSPQGSSWG